MDKKNAKFELLVMPKGELTYKHQGYFRSLEGAMVAGHRLQMSVKCAYLVREVVE
jgi:hypothetical protein